MICKCGCDKSCHRNGHCQGCNQVYKDCKKFQAQSQDTTSAEVSFEDTDTQTHETLSDKILYSVEIKRDILYQDVFIAKDVKSSVQKILERIDTEVLLPNYKRLEIVEIIKQEMGEELVK